MSVRYFLFEQDDTLRHLPLRVVEGLVVGDDRLPQYAGQHIRIAVVYLRTDNRQPVSVYRVDGSIWHFDAAGSVGESLARSAMMALSTHDHMRQVAQSSGPVVDLSARFARRQWENKNRWEPTPAQITQMVHAIWPKQAGHPITRPESISGVNKRRHPMSYSAKHALQECLMPALKVRHQLDDLSDHDLKGFVDAVADYLDPSDPAGDEIWKGIRAAAEKKLEIRKTWRSGKGKWFAAVNKLVSQGVDRGCQSITIEFRECKGKGEAVKAARELLVKHANAFDENVELEAQICPEIEWAGPGIE